TPALDLQVFEMEQSADRLRSAAAAGGIGGAFGGLATGVAILLIPTLVTAVLTVPILLALGAGASATLAAGVTAAAATPSKRMDIKLGAKDLHDLAKLALAILYGVSHQGFGLSSEI